MKAFLVKAETFFRKWWVKIALFDEISKHFLREEFVQSFITIITLPQASLPSSKDYFNTIFFSYL